MTYDEALAKAVKAAEMIEAFPSDWREMREAKLAEVRAWAAVGEMIVRRPPVN